MTPCSPVTASYMAASAASVGRGGDGDGDVEGPVLGEVMASAQGWPARRWRPPVPAVGYQLPFAVNDPTDAAKLAVRMEEDSAVAWRAVLEQANAGDDRELAVTAMK